MDDKPDISTIIDAIDEYDVRLVMAHPHRRILDRPCLHGELELRKASKPPVGHFPYILLAPEGDRIARRFFFAQPYRVSTEEQLLILWEKFKDVPSMDGGMTFIPADEIRLAAADPAGSA